MRLHEPRAFRDEAEGVFQREHAGQTRRDVFADAVSQHRRGWMPQLIQSFAKRVAEDEQCGLREARLAQWFRRERKISRMSRPSRRGRNSSAQWSMSVAEHRLGAVEDGAHVDRLRALTRKEESHRRVAARGGLAEDALTVAAFQHIGGIGEIARGDDAAMQSNARRPCCSVKLTSVGSSVGLARRWRARLSVAVFERGFGARGNDEKLALARVGFGRRGGRCFFEDRVRVRAADAEGADPGATRFAVCGCGPIQWLRVDVERAVREVEMRVRRAEVQRGRQAAML